MFLPQWVWQGHLAGEQALLLNSCGRNQNKLCGGYITVISSTLEKVGVAAEWLQSSLVFPSVWDSWCWEEDIVQSFFVVVSLLGMQKCTRRKTVFFPKHDFQDIKFLENLNKLGLPLKASPD